MIYTIHWIYGVGVDLTTMDWTMLRGGGIISGGLRVTEGAVLELAGEALVNISEGGVDQFLGLCLPSKSNVSTIVLHIEEIKSDRTPGWQD